MADCPSCAARELESRILREANQKDRETWREREAGLQARTAEAERAAKAAEQQIQAASGQDRWPSVKEFMEHCEGGTCEHSAAWRAVKAGIVQAAYQNIPKEVIEERGVALGLIPDRIIVRG